MHVKYTLSYCPQGPGRGDIVSVLHWPTCLYPHAILLKRSSWSMLPFLMCLLQKTWYSLMLAAGSDTCRWRIKWQTSITRQLVLTCWREFMGGEWKCSRLVMQFSGPLSTSSLRPFCALICELSSEFFMKSAVIGHCLLLYCYSFSFLTISLPSGQAARPPSHISLA